MILKIVADSSKIELKKLKDHCAGYAYLIRHLKTHKKQTKTWSDFKKVDFVKKVQKAHQSSRPAVTGLDIKQYYPDSILDEASELERRTEAFDCTKYHRLPSDTEASVIPDLHFDDLLGTRFLGLSIKPFIVAMARKDTDYLHFMCVVPESYDIEDTKSYNPTSPKFSLYDLNDAIKTNSLDKTKVENSEIKSIEREIQTYLQEHNLDQIQLIYFKKSNPIKI